MLEIFSANGLCSQQATWPEGGPQRDAGSPGKSAVRSPALRVMSLREGSALDMKTEVRKQLVGDVGHLSHSPGGETERSDLPAQGKAL